MHDGQIQSKTTKFVFPKGKKKHISDIENFLGNCAKFRGLRRHTFSRILKSISFDTIAEIKIYIYFCSKIIGNNKPNQILNSNNKTLS